MFSISCISSSTEFLALPVEILGFCLPVEETVRGLEGEGGRDVFPDRPLFAVLPGGVAGNAVPG